MIKMWAYDVEILPNFFSITFIDIIDYVAKFEDAVKVKIKKGKEIKEPIPLVEKYSVKDIIAKPYTTNISIIITPFSDRINYTTKLWVNYEIS